jgi:nicotinamidase-related amidase
VKILTSEHDDVTTQKVMVTMTSAPIRDPLADHLITPQNAALLLIDYQPAQVATVRTTVNSWEDTEFVDAVRATARRKLIFCALWTEVCMAFTALDAMREGYEVYPVVDAIGGTSAEAHRAGLERVTQAGGQPISWVAGVRASA